MYPSAPRRPRRLAVTIVAAAAIVTMVAGPIEAAEPPPGGTIYFHRVTLPADAYAVAPDGTGLRVVGCHPGDRTYQASPRRIVRLEERGDSFPAYTESLHLVTWQATSLVSRDGSCGDPVVLVDPPSGYRFGLPAWSADGRRVAVAVLRYNGSGQLTDQGIWVGEIGGACGAAVCGWHLAVPFPLTRVVPQMDGPFIAYYEQTPVLSWSSDGRHIVYSRVERASSARSGIFVADVGAPGSLGFGVEVHVAIGNDTGEQFDPTFSPVAGDDRIAFVQPTSSRGRSRLDLFVTASVGGTARQVTNTQNANVCQMGRPSWSPDGQWLAFDAAPISLAGQAIYRIRADGSAKAFQVAFINGAALYSPSWRP